MQLNYCLTTQYINKLKEDYFLHLIKRELKNKTIHSHILKTHNIDMKHHSTNLKLIQTSLKFLEKDTKTLQHKFWAFSQSKH